MYNLNYVYVVVSMDKEDDMIEQLINDLEGWARHLYRVDRKDHVLYRGLIPVKELESLFTLKAMSPYGSGYEITVDGVPSKDYGYYPWKAVRGIA